MSKVNKIPYRRQLVQKFLASYLERFGGSKSYLAKFLLGKIKQRCHLEGSELLATVERDIEEEINHYAKLGLINDFEYSRSKVKAWLKEGTSIFHIRQKLALKGITSLTLEETLESLDPAPRTEISTAFNNAEDDLEYYALLKYARKRKCHQWPAAVQPSNAEQTNPEDRLETPLEPRETADPSLELKHKTILARRGFPFALIDHYLASDNYYREESYLTTLYCLEHCYNLY